ncbi:MAG: hypothetical protein MJ223_00440 [Mycoplasmoidaceae bacterium]|nr:hypothetical protein [Mycoplasmoidaceae bacterium]
MPIMNLFFIGGATASIAVAVFRTGRDDGFDLNISAKPFTKGTTVALKTLVYLLIMLFLIGLTILVTSLIMPVFGEYNYDTNPLGIQLAKYQGMLVSVFVGNIVNMLLFGGVSVFISMVGGQVITIIGTVSSVFLIALLNMLYPQMLKSELDVLSDKYDANISSFVCNTLEQYNNPDSNQQPLCFATIQCTDDDISYYNTYEY